METGGNSAAHRRHARLAALLVWLGLIGAFGGGGAEVVRDEIVGSGIDWGTFNACLTFGILLAAFGECWSHAPTSATAPASRDGIPGRGGQQTSFAAVPDVGPAAKDR